MAPTSILNANGVEIGVIGNIADESAYISLTDIAKYKNSEDAAGVISNWLRNRNTLDYLGLWEQLHNPNFKLLEFEGFRNSSGDNAFTISPQKWIKSTEAIGIVSKSGRYGGTYAHSDIAFEFASWISPEFKLYIIKDYQRLKKDEAERKAIGWDEKRALSKINYHIHTDAVQRYLITDELTSIEKGYTFADEADMLNVALFGKKAREWRDEHPIEAQKGENIRDYATAEELIILVNMESQNAELIKEGLPQSERFAKLHKMARTQMQILLKNRTKEKLKNKKNILYVRCRYLQRLCGYACSRRDRLSVRDRENKAGEKCCRSRSLLPIGRFTGYSRLCGRFFGFGSMGCENRCFHIGALRCSFYGRDRQNYLSRQESTDTRHECRVFFG